jgi:hypothetical protein
VGLDLERGHELAKEMATSHDTIMSRTRTDSISFSKMGILTNKVALHGS